MKYLKKFESNDIFDIDFVLSKIKEKFDDNKVCDMLDEEIMEWVDEGWEEEYESEYDWYQDYNNREAEDVVIEQLISWYEKEHEELESNDRITLYDRISDIYTCL